MESQSATHIASAPHRSVAPTASTQPRPGLTPVSLPETPMAVLPVDPAVGLNDLTPDEEAVVAELKARDREVRAHEQAHKAVGGRYAGDISYQFQEGPDGKKYAIAGEVPIDVAPEDNPEATIAKMEVVIRAALAPTEPSAQDRAVASAAQAQLQAARSTLMSEAKEGGLEGYIAYRAMDEAATQTSLRL